MNRRIRNFLTSLSVFALLMIPGLMLTSTPAFAAATDATCGNGTSSKGQILQGVNSGGGTPDCTGTAVSSAAGAVVNILGIIVGIAAVIMVILAAFRYITSNGDSNKISSAKNALIYALVGLAVAALAQFLVHFVLNTANCAEQAGTSTACKG